MKEKKRVMKKMVAVIMAASMTMGAFSSVSMTASAESGETHIIKHNEWTDTLGVALCPAAEEKNIAREQLTVNCCNYIEDGLSVTADAYDTGEVVLTLSLAKDTVMSSEFSYIRFARDEFCYPAYLYDVEVLTSDYSHFFCGADGGRDSYGVNIFYNDFFDKENSQKNLVEKLRVQNDGAVPDIHTIGYCYGSGEYKIVPDNYNDGFDVHFDAGTVLCRVKFKPIRDLQMYSDAGREDITPISFNFFGNGEFGFNGNEAVNCKVDGGSDNRFLWYRNSTPINDFDFVTVKSYTNGDVKLDFTNNDTSREMQSIIGINNYEPEYDLTELLHGSYELVNTGGQGLYPYDSIKSRFGNICEAGEGVPVTYFVNEHSHIGTYGSLEYKRKDFSKSTGFGIGFFNTIEGYALPDRPPYTAGDTTFLVSDTEHMSILNFKNTDIGFGDSNLDGQIDLADGVFIMQSLANPDKYKLTEAGKVFADVCDIGNGITAADALNIQKYLLELIDSPVTL